MNMPTTAAELQKLLEERKLYPVYAAANGKEPYDGYALRREGNAWIVYRCGPMSAMRETYHEDEKEAVANFIKRLRTEGFADYVSDLE